MHIIPTIKIERSDIKTLITIISVLLVFTGFRLGDLVSLINQTLFPKPLDIIESVENPELFDWTREYVIPEAYYVEQKISLPTSDIIFGEDLKFKIKIINHGKNEVKEPRLVVFIMDSFLRSWGVYNNDLTKEQCDKRIILTYEFPNSDHKTLGNWRIVSLLYDNSNNALTSYNASVFYVEERSITSYLGIALLLIFVAAIIYTEIRDRSKKKIVVEIDDSNNVE